jgi:hypothetical protein
LRKCLSQKKNKKKWKKWVKKRNKILTMSGRIGKKKKENLMIGKRKEKVKNVTPKLSTFPGMEAQTPLLSSFRFDENPSQY